MGINARAHLWYGVVEKRSKLLKIADKQFGKSDDDWWDTLENLASQVGFDEIILQREGYDETEDHGVGVWSTTVYDWQGTKNFKLPNQGQLDRKWKKVASKLGIRKKPSWHLWTEYS